MKLFKRNQSPLRRPAAESDEQQGYVFRRSRTLTGTTSPKVVAGAERRSQLKTVRLKAHELHQLRNRVLQLLAGLMAVIALLSYLILNYTAQINISYPQPGGAPPSSAYQQAILDYYAKHPLERFGFALNQKQLGQELQAAYPELSSVDVDKNWYGGSSKFVLQFRKPILTWATGGRRFYVDDNGVAFGYDHFGGKYVSVSDQSGISPSASGGAVASNRFIGFLGKMVGAVNAGRKGNVTEVIIPASTREIDLKLQGRGYPIKTHTDRDPLQQAQDILVALKWFDDNKVVPKYLDVRVANRAFYQR